MRFSRRTKFKILAVGLSLCAGTIGFEILLRLINYRPAIVDPDIYVANQNELLPYKLRPGYAGYYLGQEVKTDADGYRIVSAPSRPRDAVEGGVKTIVVLGDSLVFGYGLSNEDTIGSRLQAAMVAKHANYQVKNIGAPGYSSWNEYAAIQDYLTKFKADQVLLTYNVNDITFDNDYFGIGKGRQAAFSNDRLHRFVQFVYLHVYTFYLVSDTAKKIYARINGSLKQASPSDVSELNNQPALDYSMEALSGIQKVCSDRGIEFSVGIYRDTPLYRRLPEKSLAFEGMIEQALEHRGIKWFLISSHAENLAPRDAQVFWNDPHPSPKAVEFIVADMSKEIK